MRVHRAKRFNGKMAVCGKKMGDDWDKEVALNLWTYAKIMRDHGGTLCRKCWQGVVK